MSTKRVVLNVFSVIFLIIVLAIIIGFVVLIKSCEGNYIEYKDDYTVIYKDSLDVALGEWQVIKMDHIEEGDMFSGAYYIQWEIGYIDVTGKSRIILIDNVRNIDFQIKIESLNIVEEELNQIVADYFGEKPRAHCWIEIINQNNLADIPFPKNVKLSNIIGNNNLQYHIIVPDSYWKSAEDTDPYTEEQQAKIAGFDEYFKEKMSSTINYEIKYRY